MTQKILIIRMMETPDVAAIGVPAIRYVKKRLPEASIHCLTFAQGEDIIRLAEPDVTVFSLAQEQWPADLLAAMEVFLGLAEIIVGQSYDEIINLDTMFMPCLLARFLKDAGEPVEGNLLSVSVNALIEQFKLQTLKPEFVLHEAEFLVSTWPGMSQWQTHWWLRPEPPETGYPEFYLRRCCGYGSIDMDMALDVTPAIVDEGKQYVALSVATNTPDIAYPFADDIEAALEEQGIRVWRGVDDDTPMQRKLSMLSGCALLVTVPNGNQWLASAVNTPTLMISGPINPLMFMPDYATDMQESPVAADILVRGIIEVLESQSNA